MTYTIKEAAQKSGLSIYTLRYYDKEGLLPFVSRNQSGYREFTDGDLHLINTICCLKNTGMKISAIRQYIDYVMAGPDTIEQRKTLLTAHREEVEAKQREITKNLAKIDYKLDHYSRPNAKKFVEAELKYASQEKVANNLNDPFNSVTK